MRHLVQWFFLSSFFFLISLPATAQQSPGQPDQQNNDLIVSSSPVQDSHTTQTVDPDNRPLSGAVDLSPGILHSSKNILDASFRLDQRLDARPGMAWNGDAFATLSLSRTWKRNTLVLGYDGGSTFDIGQYSQSSHSLSISQLLSLGRWSLTISDQALYSPESPFGLPGLQPTFFNFLGTNPVLLPNQTVFTGHAPRISNGSVVQLEYAISRRTSLTATGSYSLLRYTGASFNDSHQGGGTLGYNYAVTPRDNVALVYGYEQMHFNLTAEKMDVQSATLRYSHQLLGRFSIQIEGGAELTKTVSPFSPPRTSVLPNGRLALISVWRRTEFSLSASRSVMSGAGLGVATNGTTASLAATRTLSRTWIGTINGGYAQNAFIGVQGKLRSAFAEASLERTVGRHMGLFFFYNLQKQIGDSVCASSLCAGGYLRHSAGVGLNWRFKPNTSR